MAIYAKPKAVQMVAFGYKKGGQEVLEEILIANHALHRLNSLTMRLPETS